MANNYINKFEHCYIYCREYLVKLVISSFQISSVPKIFLAQAIAAAATAGAVK